MNTIENTVGGTYRDGKIVLDRPMKWKDGTRVVVQLMPDPAESGLIDGVWPADGSPEGDAEILRRMEEPVPPELQPTEKEIEDFRSSMEEVRSYHRKPKSSN